LGNAPYFRIAIIRQSRKGYETGLIELFDIRADVETPSEKFRIIDRL
jgi:hypothetical protein